MTNDELLSKCAPFLRELAESLGQSITLGVRLPDECIPRTVYTAHVGGGMAGYGHADTPFAALTAALADYERREAEKATRAQIEAEVAARLALKAA